jgi:hypothetical protein
VYDSASRRHRHSRRPSTQYSAGCQSSDNRYGGFIHRCKLSESIQRLFFGCTFRSEPAEQTQHGSCSLRPGMWDHARYWCGNARNPSDDWRNSSGNACNSSGDSPQCAECAAEEFIGVFRT